MDFTQRHELGHSRCDLPGPEQRRRGNRLQLCESSAFEQRREVHRQRSGNKPGRREYEREQEHFSIGSPTNSPDGLFSIGWPIGCSATGRLMSPFRENKAVERKADQQIKSSPRQTRLSPADRVV